MNKKGKWVNTPIIDAWFPDERIELLCDCDPKDDTSIIQLTPSEVKTCPNCKKKYRVIVFMKPQVWVENNE